MEISSLSVGGSPRLAGESLEHVETLIASETELPPIIVHRPTMRVIDGMHRLLAMKRLGHRKIAVRFFEGSEDEAFVLAVKSNIAHGLPLSLADRKHAAARVVASHPEWSDRMIASVTGISAKTVAEIRKSANAEPPDGGGRIGKDGRVRAADVTERRRVAQELIIKDPGLSLRQVARAAGISPETVRDVRKRLRRGEDPLPQGRAKGAAGGQDADGRPARRTGIAEQPTPGSGSPPPPAVVVERLKADPALRFNENGRDLLRLLNIHALRTEDWSKIIDSVPPHCIEIVAHLARDCSKKWLEFASLVERNAMDPDFGPAGRP
ncbi:ParB/RepB/Spo0J family partition protein [Nonomuraea turkmeniaca]|uniref:ParB/RepB/Spo0J family partition protein n=1 Tax=Nonomuraea turkmeniaca TaxID=103838 RepID=UPI001FE5C68C|nr:helix-turn-helix domain-containing protein [Nonomuraea turkmeniaca]